MNSYGPTALLFYYDSNASGEVSGQAVSLHLPHFRLKAGVHSKAGGRQRRAAFPVQGSSTRISIVISYLRRVATPSPPPTTPAQPAPLPL